MWACTHQFRCLGSPSKPFVVCPLWTRPSLPPHRSLRSLPPAGSQRLENHRAIIGPHAPIGPPAGAWGAIAKLSGMCKTPAGNSGVRGRTAEVIAVAWFIGQSLLVIAAAFLLGVLVGWLIWGVLGRRTRHDETAATPAKPVPAVAMPVASAAVAAPMTALAMESAPTPERLPAPEPEPSLEPSLEPSPQPSPEPEIEPEPEPSTEPEPEPSPKQESEPEPDLEPVPVAEKASAVVIPVQAADEPVDDLERIEGIGPKMSGALVHAGIRTYAQLAAADATALREAIEARGLRFAPSLVTWGQQAQLLADGDEEGFADLTRRLVAGRDEGRE